MISTFGETFINHIMRVVDDEDDRTPTYYVDIPPTNGSDEWTIVESFKYRPDAIAFATERFNADENGMVSLISQS